MSSQGDNNDRFFELSRGSSSTSEGIVTDVDLSGRVVSVNVGGLTRAMPWFGDAPWKGSRVRIIVAGQRPICTPVWPAAVGTVTGVDGDFVIVTGDDSVVSRYPSNAAQLFAVDDRVAMNHATQSVMFQLSTDPSLDTPVVPPAPPGTGGVRTVVFSAHNSGNWYSAGGRYDGQEVKISTTRSGYYFYGHSIADTIPNTATLLAANIQLVETGDSVPGTPTLMGLHGMGAPVAPPSAITGGYIPVSGSGTYDIGSFAPYLRDGTALGIGFVQDTGFRQFANYTVSGTITIAFQ